VQSGTVNIPDAHPTKRNGTSTEPQSMRRHKCKGFEVDDVIG
jgi:hypothetical protein